MRQNKSLAGNLFDPGAALSTVRRIRLAAALFCQCIICCGRATGFCARSVAVVTPQVKIRSKIYIFLR